MDKKQLGLNIKRERKRLGLTQETLAAKVNVSHNYISAIECGKKTPKLEMFFKIADALNVSIDTLAEDITLKSKQNSIASFDRRISDLNDNEYRLLKNTVDNLLEYFENSKNVKNNF